MKILDRYVLRSFLMNYLISLMVLIGMYIVLDMVFNFDELVKEPKGGIDLTTAQVVGGVISYYFFQSFLIFVHLSGVIPVVAAAFTLIRMSRFNELSAILAAGVPLLRLAAPIILASVFAQVVLFADQELVIPNIIPKLTRQHDQVYNDANVKGFPVQNMQDDKGGLIFAGAYKPATSKGPATLEPLDVLENTTNLQGVTHLLAEKAEYDADGVWKLTKGQRLTGLHADPSRSQDGRIGTWKTNVTPDEIELQHSGEFVNLLSRDKINQLLQRPKVYGATDLLRVKHFRLAQLVMNVVMVLVAIPCVLTREPGKLKVSIIKCLVYVGLCMATFFIAYQVAGNPRGGPEWADRWPAMVAFGPILIFGVVAALLLDRLANRDT